MKINIISDKESGWILYKFAKNVYDQLISMGYEAKLSYEYDSNFDVNHYFTPGNVGLTFYNKVDKFSTFMITHVDTQLKIDEIKELTKKGAIGICMSQDTKNKMIAAGVDPSKVCYVNPAQDGQIQPKKIKLGFTHRIYNDNRKRDEIILDVCDKINSSVFEFVIMGAGWEKIIEEIKSKGFNVTYYPDFDKQKYNQIMVNLDYYCYFGTDEGSMGFLDAIAAGIGTIVSPQGYHLDTGCPISYPVKTVDDIVDALNDIEKKREKNIRFINQWTWKNYTLKHIEIWKYLTHSDKIENILSTRGNYIDGIYSLVLDDLNYYKTLRQHLSKE